MLETAKRYRELALSLLKHADESGPEGPRDALINLAVFYQQAAHELERVFQGWQASTSRSGPIVERSEGRAGSLPRPPLAVPGAPSHPRPKVLTPAALPR
jgi:hypothetical protein